MKFEILSSEKFDYMMLSRLIQDAKYFITYPELKHLWTHDLNKHIEEMKKQYNKLDPKPEWTSLSEIEDLAKQMKESYKNHWNERHPNNKIEAAEQPTTPKPTTTLPDNMTWAWDPKANQWIAVMKDNPVVTPPTYNPNNTTLNNNQTYTSIKSSLIDSLNQFLDSDKYSREIKIEKGLINNGLIKLAYINPIKGPKYSITDKGLKLLKQESRKEYNKVKKSYLLDGISDSKIKTGTPEEQGKMPKFSVFEKDGSELAQIEAKNSTDAKVKFIMQHPEYEGSQTISIKKIDSTYSETTTQGLDFPNQSVSPSTDIKVDTKGWVNVQSAKINPIKKKADMADDLTFEADVSEIKVDTSSLDYRKIFSLLREKYPQLANISDDLLYVYDEDWYGSFKWGLDIQVKSWGIQSFNLITLPAKITCNFNISYSENEEAKRNGYENEEMFELEFNFDNVFIESNINLEDGSDIFVKEVEITDIDTATLHI